MNKKFAAAGLAAGLVAGTGAGFILQLAGSAGAASGAAITASTDESTTSEGDRPDPSTRLAEVLQPLVADGTITQAQLDKVVETLIAAGPMRGGPGGRGPGLQVVADTLGMTPDEVREAISNGQTLAQLAESKGSTAQALIDAMVAEAKTRLDEKVAAGDLTQEQVDARLATATERVTELVNNTPAFRDGRGHGRGHGSKPADETTSDETTSDETAAEEATTD